eukprot:m.208732 g.208732  ORF g.208732 m.208732 type:complete len:199 (+) comp10132_c1_seq26:408-1004(+)
MFARAAAAALRPVSRPLLCGPVRMASTNPPRRAKQGSASTLMYIASAVVFFLGASYAAVPLYRLFCQATGFGGTTSKAEDAQKIRDMVPVPDRRVRIKFIASTSKTMTWKFFPQQKEITVVPGETALAFFTAQNPTDEAITGISTYNVLPYEVQLTDQSIGLTDLPTLDACVLAATPSDCRRGSTSTRSSASVSRSSG